MAIGGPVLQVAILGACVLGLWGGARALVDAVVQLARQRGVSELTIGLTIVAIGTSTPELVVSVQAAAIGAGEIAVGNVIGSNSYNLAFILGVTALVGVIPVERSLLHRDGMALLVATAAGGTVLLDLAVGRLEGLGLVGLFAAYTGYLLWDEHRGAGIETVYSQSKLTAIAEPRVASPVRLWGFLAGGLLIVLVSGQGLVVTASSLARLGGISEWVIGGTVVAAGTSTPELAVSLMAMREGHVGMAVGNVVGSNILNILGIVGLGALLRPMMVAPLVVEGMLWLAVLTVVTVAALWSGRRLSRAEGGVFVVSEVARWTLSLLRVFG